MEIIDGKKIAAEVRQEIAREVELLTATGARSPHLAAVLVGHDGASETYVAGKVKACAEVGFRSTLIRYEDEVTEEELLKAVRRLNEDGEVDGFIVQLPLPPHINEKRIIEAIDYRKDVDGFHPVNIGRMVLGMPCFVSATPAGVLELIRRYNIQTSGKRCVIVGRSNIVGKPLSILLSQKSYPGDATVTLAHSRTNNLPDLIRESDIVVAALGQPGFIRGDMVREGAVVIDVGITRVKSDTTKSGFRLAGDVCFEEVAPKCSYITPVPGGVGLMTVVSLLRNTLTAARREIGYSP
jgi:methylenetetrahydrofolate dehydrogenase (NADP+)/methenyltetrahydrofolate cyclohydrolase